MNLKYLSALALISISPCLAIAGPESAAMEITNIRPYRIEGGGRIYIDVNSSSFCNTMTFSIDNTLPGSKQAYAAALSAMLAGKKVRLEVDTCAGWGTTLR